MLPGGEEAARWLRSLKASFHLAAAAKPGTSQAPSSPNVARVPPEDPLPSLSNQLIVALPALLCHPSSAVQKEAASALAEAARVVPLLGISFLPLILYHLQSSVGRDKSALPQTGAQLISSAGLALGVVVLRSFLACHGGYRSKGGSCPQAPAASVAGFCGITACA